MIAIWSPLKADPQPATGSCGVFVEAAKDHLVTVQCEVVRDRLRRRCSSMSKASDAKGRMVYQCSLIVWALARTAAARPWKTYDKPVSTTRTSDRYPVAVPTTWMETNWNMTMTK